ncbi:hypothetical protein O3G_MSEX002094 [Manduca sexta]|nr:hypothetical protein O3G_MSEX002094 [Manduca sexta]
MTLRAVTVVLAVLCCTRCTNAKHDKCDGCDVVVKLKSGPICGSVELAENATKYYSFKGIPYAKPPTGARRFAPLQKCKPWTNIRLTVLEGPVCPQLDEYYGIIPFHPNGMEEDCMYANVYSPICAKLNGNNLDEGLPILVNIHGGAYQSGSGNPDLHGPGYLMYKGDVVVMSFNYRLAVFGFLSLDSDKIPGNNGLRDIIFFLQWVQENAKAFGGNPRDVTLIGHSMAAMTVHLLSLSKAAEGLFQRLIMLSGTAIPMFYSASPVYARFVAGMFLKAAGITATDPAVIHKQLIKMPLNDIMYANSIVQYKTGITTFVPVVESDHPGVTKVLDDEPLKLIEQGRGANIPLLVGFTSSEMVFIRRLLINLNMLGRIRKDPRHILSPRLIFSLNATDARHRGKRVLERYFHGAPSIENLIHFMSDNFFRYPTFKLAQFRNATGAAPMYLYEFSYESLFSVIKRALWESYCGASHLEDFTYIFRTDTILRHRVSFPPVDSDDEMKDWMTDFVLNFVRCDNPTCRDDATSPWPPTEYPEIRLQSIAKPRMYNMVELSDEFKDMVNFFDSIDSDIA